MQQQATQFLDIYRAGLRTATDVMKTSLESAERMQQQQLQMLRGAMEENAKSASQLAETKSLEDLMTLQTRLARSQLERAMEFWGGWWRAATENQAVLIGQMQSQLSQARDQFQESYAYTARATEEIARRAASQVQAATGSLADAASPQGKRGHGEAQRRSA